MNSLEALNDEIVKLQRMLRARKLARLALLRGESELPVQDLVYYGKRPGEIISVLLKDGPRKRQELLSKMVAGGITVNRKRGVHNIRISFEQLLKNGSLLERGEYVSLPGQRDLLEAL